MKLIKLLILLLVVSATASVHAQTVGGGTPKPVPSFEGLGTADSIQMSNSRITISGEEYRLASGAKFMGANGQTISPASVSSQVLVSFVFTYSSPRTGLVLPTNSNGLVSEVRLVAPHPGAGS